MLSNLFFKVCPDSLSASQCEAFIINPHMQSVIIRDEPPEEKNGNGIPVVGEAPQTTAQLKTDWQKMQSVHPNEP